MFQAKGAKARLDEILMISLRGLSARVREFGRLPAGFLQPAPHNGEIGQLEEASLLAILPNNLLAIAKGKNRLSAGFPHRSPDDANAGAPGIQRPTLVSCLRLLCTERLLQESVQRRLVGSNGDEIAGPVAG
jgi:hypothetical protein